VSPPHFVESDLDLPALNAAANASLRVEFPAGSSATDLALPGSVITGLGAKGRRSMLMASTHLAGFLLLIEAVVLQLLDGEQQTLQFRLVVAVNGVVARIQFAKFLFFCVLD